MKLMGMGFPPSRARLSPSLGYSSDRAERSRGLPRTKPSRAFVRLRSRNASCETRFGHGCLSIGTVRSPFFYIYHVRCRFPGHFVKEIEELRRTAPMPCKKLSILFDRLAQQLANRSHFRFPTTSRP